MQNVMNRQGNTNFGEDLVVINLLRGSHQPQYYPLKLTLGNVIIACEIVPYVNRGACPITVSDCWLNKPLNACSLAVIVEVDLGDSTEPHSPHPLTD